ncbi:MAG: DUF1176 domain-containing protein [Gammaproteobacteria bacterium]
MDEFQGRLGTPGALVKKGSKDEASVLPSLPMPVVVAEPLVKPLPSDIKILTDSSHALREALRATLEEGECPDLLENEADEAELTV